MILSGHNSCTVGLFVHLYSTLFLPGMDHGKLKVQGREKESEKVELT